MTIIYALHTHDNFHNLLPCSLKLMTPYNIYNLLDTKLTWRFKIDVEI